MYSGKISYYDGDVECHGFLAYDDELDIKRPCILIAHTWRGQDDLMREKALELAQLGYVGFAIDMYGDGQHTEDNEVAAEWMKPYYLDRELLQRRIVAAVDCIREHPMVDPTRLGALGYCFGGLVVYELLRCGAGVEAVCTMHGVFSEMDAKTTLVSPNARGHLLVLHGHDDPMVSSADLKKLEDEMSKAGIDWQIHIYGKTMHGFTNPKANTPEKGVLYCHVSAKRAWLSMQRFFEETI